MAMSSEVRVAYDDALRRAILRPKQSGAWIMDAEDGNNVYCWFDSELMVHHWECESTSTETPVEDRWDEFIDTEAPNQTKYGVRLDGVNCACGVLVNRSVRWEARWSVIAESIFAETFDAREAGHVPYPTGLCPTRGDHPAHDYVSDTLGEFYCTGREFDRQPGKSERIRREDGK